jgi:hypothetical protein
MKLTSNSKLCNLVKAGLACVAAFGLLQGTSAQAQGQISFDHLNAGAVGTGYGDQLIWANGALFASSSGYYYSMTKSTAGTYAGYYNSSPTLTVLPATADNLGPVPNAPALGSFIQATITLVSEPDGGSFSFWDVGATTPTYTLNPGDISPEIPLSDVSLGAGDFGADPYGHIHGRRFTATVPGDYIVGFQLFDTDDNGLDGLPIHTPSDILYMDFRTAVPEPSTNALAGMGLVAFGLMAFKRIRSERSKS